MIEESGLMWEGSEKNGFTATLDKLYLRIRPDRSWEIRNLKEDSHVDESVIHETFGSSRAAMEAASARARNLLDPNQPDIRGLRQFADETDRHLTELFVGRDNLLEKVRNNVARVVQKRNAGNVDPAAGATMLITGAPGAGKTAMLHKLKQEWRDLSPNARTPLAITVPLGRLGKPEDLAAYVRQQFSARIGTTKAVADGSFFDRLNGLGVSILGNGVNFSLKDKDADLVAINRPVALMIDEIQNVPANREDPVGRLLEELHLGTHGAAIVPVFAGLASSESRLEAAGISRIAPRAILALGVLDEKDVATSVKRFMGRYKVRGDLKDWPKRIADWSDGWPMHLHNTLTALAGELSGNNGNLGDVDIGAVRREAADIRAKYYGRRTAGPVGDSPVLLARVMDAIPPAGTDRDDCKNMIEDADEKGRQEKARRLRRRATLPEGMSVSDMFAEMQRKGLIQLGDGISKRFICPIPSMRNWCAAESGGLLHTAAMMGEMHKMAADVRSGSDPNGADALGRTALHWAAKGDWPEVARTLLKLGSNPNASDNDGRTPMHLGATRRMEAEPGVSPGIVQLLTSAGGDMHATDNEGKTPLHLAAEFARSSEIVRQLLDAGADPEAKDNEGNTPLDVAIECGKGETGETVRLLAALAPPGSVPGFEMAAAERFKARVERRDLTSSESERIVLGEDSGTWSFIIRDSAANSLDAPARHGTGYASVDLACEAARAALDECKSARAQEAESDPARRMDGPSF